MPSIDDGRARQRPYKVWRYPGVPIPPRLRSVYRDPTVKRSYIF